MKNKLRSFLTLSFLVLITINLKSFSEEVEDLKGFDAKSDLRIGPILTIGLPISVNKSNVAYNPVISLNFHGESYTFGSSGFEISWLSLNRGFSQYQASATSTLKFSDVSPANQITKITKNLLLITLSSPMFYKAGNNFEFGWLGGIFNQFVSAEGLQGDSSGNLGLNLGAYVKSYQLYPFVPYVNAKGLFGNLYDNGKTIQEASGQKASLKGGYILSSGFDFYFSRRIFFNFGFNMTNLDFYTFSPTKRRVVQPTQVSPEPNDDQNISFDEVMNSVSGSFGFLF